MIHGYINTKAGGPVQVKVEFLRDGESYIRIGEYEFPLDTFVNELIFNYVGEHAVVGYLNQTNRNKSGKTYELRTPTKRGVRAQNEVRR